MANDTDSKSMSANDAFVQVVALAAMTEDSVVATREAELSMQRQLTEMQKSVDHLAKLYGPEVVLATTAQANKMIAEMRSTAKTSITDFDGEIYLFLRNARRRLLTFIVAASLIPTVIVFAATRFIPSPDEIMKRQNTVNTLNGEMETLQSNLAARRAEFYNETSKLVVQDGVKYVRVDSPPIKSCNDPIHPNLCNYYAPLR